MHKWLIAGLLVGCGSAPETSVASDGAQTTPAAEAAGKRKDIGVEAFAKAHAAGAVVIDVRTPSEFARGHVPGAKNIPVADLDAAAIASLPKDSEVFLICQAGGRSAMAADTLASQGFKAVNVMGGTGEWISKGHPVE